MIPSLLWIKHPGSGVLSPPPCFLPAFHSPNLSRCYLGGSQHGMLKGCTYSAAKANRSSPAPWLREGFPDLLL